MGLQEYISKMDELPCRLKRCLKMLKLIKKNKKLGVKLINNNNDLAKCLCDCAYNIVHGNINIDQKTKNKLFKYRTKLHALSKPSISLNSKKKILKQKGGGFLPLLIVPILSLLSDIIINKN